MIYKGRDLSVIVQGILIENIPHLIDIKFDAEMRNYLINEKNYRAWTSDSIKDAIDFEENRLKIKQFQDKINIIVGD